MQKPILKFNLNEKKVVKILGDKPFWSNGERFGWNVECNNNDYVIFATKRLNGDIERFRELYGKEPDIKAEIHYSDAFKGYKTYYLRALLPKK